MTNVAIIRVDFLSWWLAGTGAGLGATADVRAHRAADGWPSVPMTQIKGTLLETAEELVGAGHLDANLKQAIFGTTEKEAGIAFDGQALVPLRLRSASTGPEALFKRISSTAIEDLGAAKDQTLRAVEAVCPLRLEGMVRAMPGAPSGWLEALDMICGATLALGRDKTSFGEMLAQCLEAESPQNSDIRKNESVPVQDHGAKAGVAQVLEVVLRQRVEASFSDRPATEGVQKTLPTPTGASLLGWCAGRYADFEDPTQVFHSGAVRFGMARPDAGEGMEVLPIPKTLAVPKAVKSKISSDVIDVEYVRQGRPLTDNEKLEARGTQYAAIGDGFMTTGLRRLSVHLGQRTRTATKGSRAREHGLFTAQHIDPQARGSGPPLSAMFRAQIHISEDVLLCDRELIAERLAESALRLGADRRTGKGGLFDARVRWRDTPEIEKLSFDSGRLVPVLCLSDVAAMDADGCPSPIILPKALGLGAARLCRDRSVLSQRRYAPWNGLFGAHIEERMVIEAGSVLVYELAGTVKDVHRRQCVGMYQAEGLGEVVVAPDLLAFWCIVANRSDTEEFFEPVTAVQYAPIDIGDDDSWRARIARMSATLEMRDG
ncbi:hypothetical protein [Roseovarius sp.]|uniref:hypothetical protein n=1 Tax=Roseovarius sp. TaxID=1486281 RepID=UPI0035623B65